MGNEQCHHHYATHYRNQWRSLPPFAKRLQELASHSHSVQNICFTRGDRFCHSFVYDNQSTWKNFHSFGSEHKSIRSEHKSIRSEHKSIRSEHKSIRSEHESIRSEHESIRSEHESIRSEHESIRSEHESIRSEHKSIR
ncbi:hypothetical protein [Nostoc favosum]|uniref:Uncharacterized protein n=1 Tax=Nostoc favosum CHAB5714 TaxID=2780399 RepID=A0ABS8I466_9NOSO|nr:hypothetical protein [Nostoc favosum]MCC5598975.1 hypothetical protein [Nostoc favosum CHAB5714]